MAETIKVTRDGAEIQIDPAKYESIYKPAGYLKAGDVTSPTPPAPKTPTPSTPPGSPIGSSTLSMQEGQVKSGEQVDINNPEVKQLMGQGLTAEAAIGTVVSRTPRTFITSDTAKKDVSNNIKKLEEAKALAEQQTSQPTTKVEPTPTEESGYYSDELSKIDKEYEQFNSELEKRKALLEERNKQQIAEIQRIYAERKEQMKVVNANRNKGLEIIGTRTGRQRYAPTIQEGILSAEEKAGIKRLSELDAEERSLILQAERAKEDADWQLLSQQMSLISEKRKEKNALIQQQMQMAIQKETLAMQKTKAAREEKQSLLQDLSLIGTTGQSLTNEEASVFDNLLGMKSGFTKSYIDLQATIAKAEKDKINLDTMSKWIDMASKIEKGQTIQLPDGSTISGLKEVDPMKGINRFTETDAMGNVTEIYSRWNPQTGQAEVLDILTYPGIGKEISSADDTPDFKERMSLRKEFNSQPEVKQFTDLKRSYLSTKSAYNEALSKGASKESKAAADQALVTLFNKMLDPTSVVREGEYARSFEGQAAMARAQGYMEKVLKGGAGLTDANRKDMVDMAERLYNDAKVQYDSTVDYYKELAEGYGIPANEVIKPIGDAEKKQSPTSYNTLSDFIADTQNENGTSIYQPYINELKDYYKEQGITDATEEEVLYDLEGLLKRRGVDFNQDLSKSQNGLGSLSAEYESGDDAGAIGYDSTGGWSYGKYQLTKSAVKTFLQTNPALNQLFTGLEIGSKAFNNKWKKVSKEKGEEFARKQHEFIDKSHFQPQISKISRAGIDIDSLSPVLKDVIWSTAVQHGANTNIIINAIKNVGINDERELIKEIYKQRWSGGKEFASSTPEVKKSVYNRFFGKNGEMNKALNKLG